MSLVVGAVVGERVILIGETAVTLHDWHREPRRAHTGPWLSGVLKVYRLNNMVAFGFAGESIEEFSNSFSALDSSTDGMTLALRAAALQSEGGRFDLLIGEVGYPRLRVVKDGVIHESTEGFVGDADAYREFKQRSDAWVDPLIQLQKASPSEMEISREGSAYCRMMDAFNTVLEQNSGSGVSGIATPLCSLKGEFGYMMHTKTFLPSQTIPSGEWTALNLIGSAEEGCYTGELCCAHRNKDLLGFYFLQGGFGVVFPRENQCVSRAKLVAASDPAEWMLGTKNLLGEPLPTCWLQDHHCMLAGERALCEERETDAIYFYELRDWQKVFKEKPEFRDRFVSGYATALYNARRPIDALTLLGHFIGLGPAPLAVSTLAKLHEAIPRVWH